MEGWGMAGWTMGGGWIMSWVVKDEGLMDGKWAVGDGKWVDGVWGVGMWGGEVWGWGMWGWGMWGWGWCDGMMHLSSTLICGGRARKSAV